MKMTISFDENRKCLIKKKTRRDDEVPIDWFMVRAQAENKAVLQIGKLCIYPPNEWIGKKVRIKLEEIKTGSPIVLPKPLDEIHAEMWKEKPREKYEFDNTKQYIFMCATCREETECFCCSECEFFYCEKHISLREMDRTLCDGCYTNLLKAKITVKDITPADKIMEGLKQLEKKDD